MIGRDTNALVFAGNVPAAVLSETLYHAGTVKTDVEFAVTRPQCGVALPVFSTTVKTWPCTPAADAVSGVAVTVPVVALPAVNGEPVADDSAVPPMAPKLPSRAHSVTASGPV